MRSGKKTFRHQSLQDRKTIQDILKSIADGIARGKITFSDDDDKIVQKPEGLLDLRVTATQDGNRNQFSIKVGWQLEDDAASGKKRLSVK